MTASVPSSIARAVRAPAACRWCRGPLSALARIRGDTCDAMDCRRRAADARVRAREAARLDGVRDAAARAWNSPALATAPVLWLRHHASDLAPPSQAEIAGLREHLLGLEADAAPPSALDDRTDDAPSPAIAGQLCALCRGRCCRFGLQGRAFLEAHQLRGWLAQRPGASWADAVDHYLGFVPPAHLHASCLFHAEHGCALPRERRSDVCNQFACDTLERVRDIAAADAQAVVVVGIVESHVARDAAVVSAQGRRPLPGLRGSE